MIQPTDVIIGVKLDDTTDVATSMLYQLREWFTQLSKNFIISDTHTKVNITCINLKLLFYYHLVYYLFLTNNF